MIYKWKGPLERVPAQQAGEHLEELRERHMGRLTPAVIVEDARPDDALLHSYFEWDDSKAAEAHRLEQARQLLRMIVVVREDHPTAAPVRAFVNIREDEPGSYTSMEVAMSDPRMRSTVLRRAMQELENWQQRYADLVEFADIFRAIDAAGRGVASDGTASHGVAGEANP